jgi:hypothetical protein
LTAAFAVVPILVAMSLTDKLIASYFLWDPSGRTIARELQLQKIPADQLSVTSMSRGMQFSLNFYLHQEVKTWDLDNPTEGYLLLGSKAWKHWVPPPLVCEEIPFDSESTGRFLYRVTGPCSAGRADGSGEAHKKE